jgi:hypothetical protein
MRHAELITYGLDDDAAERLRALVRDRGVGVRITRNAKACLNLLRQEATGVLLVRAGRDLEAEFGLVAQATRLFPAVSTILWLDADYPRLAGLAWDLGARGVFLPPHELERLHEMIQRLLPE